MGRYFGVLFGTWFGVFRGVVFRDRALFLERICAWDGRGFVLVVCILLEC